MAAKKSSGVGLSARDKMILIIVLGLVIVGCVYFFIFRSNIADAEEIEATNAGLETELASLQSMDANRQATEEDTAAKKAMIQEMLNAFPSEVTEEKVIEIIKDMEDETKVVVSSIGFNMDQQFYPDPAAVAAAEAAAAAEGGEGTEGTATTEAAPVTETAPAEGGEFVLNVDNLIGYKHDITLSFVGSYDQVRAMIDYVNEATDKMRFSTLSLAYNTTDGNLNGSMSLSMYSIYGNGKEYVEPSIKNVKLKVDSIFGNQIDVPVEQKEKND